MIDDESTVPSPSPSPSLEPPSDRRSRFKRAARRLIFTPVPHLAVLVDHRRILGSWPHPLSPRRFSDVVVRRLLIDRDQRYPVLADKRAVRDYVVARTDQRYLADLYASGSRWEDLNWDSLPTRFALKATHDSGSVLVIPDRRSASADEARRRVETWLKHDYGRVAGEWWYSKIPRRLMVEELLEEGGRHQPIEYRFWAIHGRVHLVMIKVCAPDGTWCYDLRTPDGAVLSATYATYPGPDGALELPSNHHEMLRVAESLAAGLDFVRVDLYNLAGRIVFREMTLAPSAGLFWFSDPALEQRLIRAWTSGPDPDPSAGVTYSS